MFGPSLPYSKNESLRILLLEWTHQSFDHFEGQAQYSPSWGETDYSIYLSSLPFDKQLIWKNSKKNCLSNPRKKKKKKKTTSSRSKIVASREQNSHSKKTLILRRDRKLLLPKRRWRAQPFFVTERHNLSFMCHCYWSQYFKGKRERGGGGGGGFFGDISWITLNKKLRWTY